MHIDTLHQAGPWPNVARTIRSALNATIAAARLFVPDDAELSLVLTDDAHMRGINRQWREKDGSTNVLSFPAEPRKPGIAPTIPVLGDIVLAYETTAREAGEQGKTFDHHLAHLVAHGLLHLFGYDHETDADAEEMEAYETAAMARLGIPDPYQ